MAKPKPTLRGQVLGIGCTILVVVIGLVFLYYATAGDLLVVGIATVIALLFGLYGLISGNPVNN